MIKFISILFQFISIFRNFLKYGNQMILIYNIIYFRSHFFSFCSQFVVNFVAKFNSKSAFKFRGDLGEIRKNEIFRFLIKSIS